MSGRESEWEKEGERGRDKERQRETGREEINTKPFLGSMGDWMFVMVPDIDEEICTSRKQRI